MVKVRIDRLNSGAYIVRPEYGLGTCGWHPFPWTMGTGKTREGALRSFEATNHKYITDKLQVIQ